MSKVIHTYIDNDGKTNVDEFSLGNMTIDMDAPPEEYHVSLFLRSNARFIAEKFKECDDGKYTRRLMLACPNSGMASVGTWQQAKDKVREMCFENPHPVCGGLRPATMRDYTNAMTVRAYKDLFDLVNAKTKELLKSRSRRPLEQAVTAALKNGDNSGGLNNDLLISAVSSHPLWRRLSWIRGADINSVMGFVGLLVDPTWYVNIDHPKRSGLFKERCGLYNALDADSGSMPESAAWFSLTKPFRDILTGNMPPPNVLSSPAGFFDRYALKMMQAMMDEGAQTNVAAFNAMWYYAVKLADYIWLNWMETTHTSSEYVVDDERFFYGDVEAAEASYCAASS